MYNTTFWGLFIVVLNFTINKFPIIVWYNLQVLTHSSTGLLLPAIGTIPKLYTQKIMFIKMLGQCVLYGYNDPYSPLAMSLQIFDKLAGFGSLLILAICNIVIMVKHARSNRIMRGLVHPGNPSSSARQSRLTIVTSFIILLFILSVIPYMVLKIIFLWSNNLFRSMMGKIFILTSFWLLHISSVFNPVLYVLQMGKRVFRIPTLDYRTRQSQCSRSTRHRHSFTVTVFGESKLKAAISLSVGLASITTMSNIDEIEMECAPNFIGGSELESIWQWYFQEPPEQEGVIECLI